MPASQRNRTSRPGLNPADLAVRETTRLFGYLPLAIGMLGRQLHQRGFATAQQGEILALLLGDPDLELSLTEIAARTGAPHPSVYREIQRAEQADLVTSRKIGNTRLVRANTTSPYYRGLADVLTRAFGVPAVLAEALRDADGITAA